MIRAFIRGVGVWGPGLEGWAAARAVLAGEADWLLREQTPSAPPMLSPNERRRASLVVRLALIAAEEARTMAGISAASLRTLFASSNGDGAVVHAILSELARPDGQVSPTQFHNSVHNAATGYWSIGASSTAPANCIGCHDATAAAGLLKAAAECAAERAQVLLVLYDASFPAPLAAVRPTNSTFAAALVLAPEAHDALAEIAVDYLAEACHPGKSRSPALSPKLDRLAHGNAAARILPVLQALAVSGTQRIALPMLDGSVLIDIAPCSAAPRSPR